MFTGNVLIKIQAEASDSDGSIAEVQFFTSDSHFGTRLIGTVTNSPFDLIWQIDLPLGSSFDLTAVAVDNLGATSGSDPVTLWTADSGPRASMRITSPADGTLFAAPATFVFSAELLASDGGLSPVAFFVGTNQVGSVSQTGLFTVDTPPYSLTVSNLAEGQYRLSVQYDQAICWTCELITNTIQVVKLGINLPTLATNGDFQFNVVTSFAGQPNLIQASTNLADWVSISTNVPAGNSFIFTEPWDATSARRFYRAWVPP